MVTWFTLILTPFLLVFGQQEAIKNTLIWLEWIADISWTIEICLSFITAGGGKTKFKEIARDYLSLWFWIDSIATFPCMLLKQRNDTALLLKMLRLLHLLEIFYPIKLLLSYLMRDKIQKEIDNAYSLAILFTGVMLFAHFSACFLIFLGLQEDGFMTELIENDTDGVWSGYGPSEIYIFSIYWILTVVTTVGYGDFTGQNNKEMLYSILLEFGGLLLFSTLTGILVELVQIGGNFKDLLADYMFNANVWVLKLEKANDKKRETFMPAPLYKQVTEDIEQAFERDFNLIIEQAEFYQQLKPQDQTLLIKTLFEEFRTEFRNFFDPCEQGFVNEAIINLAVRRWKKDDENPSIMVHQKGLKMQELFFITKGVFGLYNHIKERQVTQLPPFIVLSSCSVFGDYQILFDLYPNMDFKTYVHDFRHTLVH